MRYQEAIPGRSMGMEARYATRKQQLLAECQVAPEIFDQVLPRLATFMAPLVETFTVRLYLVVIVVAPSAACRSARLTLPRRANALL